MAYFLSQTKNKPEQSELCSDVARPEGFEPPSFGIGIHCDIQLRHGRKYLIDRSYYYADQTL